MMDENIKIKKGFSNILKLIGRIFVRLESEEMKNNILYKN